MLGRKSSSSEIGLLYQLLEMKMNWNEIYQSLDSTSGRGVKCTRNPKSKGPSNLVVSITEDLVRALE